MTNIAMVFRWPIEIDGLPIKHGIFPWICQITGYLTVCHGKLPIYRWLTY